MGTLWLAFGRVVREPPTSSWLGVQRLCSRCAAGDAGSRPLPMPFDLKAPQQDLMSSGAIAVKGNATTQAAGHASLHSSGASVWHADMLHINSVTVTLR